MDSFGIFSHWLSLLIHLETRYPAGQSYLSPIPLAVSLSKRCSYRSRQKVNIG